MKYVLIDTCSWQNLLTDKIENQLLKDLERLISNGHISMVTHELIVQEWDNNKRIEEKKLSQSVSTKYRHARQLYSELENIPILIEPNVNHIINQIETIDLLLEKAVKLGTSDKVKGLCSDKALMHKAPFHDKARSQKDAYIVYSAIEHFEKSSKEFCFISHNKNDFADLNSTKRKIHPDILEDHPDFIIDYYIDIGRAISDFKKEFGLSSLQTASYQQYEFGKKHTLIDTSKNKLDQIYDYLKLMFAQFRYVPVQLLLKDVPFNINQKSSYPYYSLFTLYIEDSELFEIFEGLGGGTDRNITIEHSSFNGHNQETSEKVSFILKTLRTNLIYHIAHKNSRNEQIEIGKGPEKECNCSKCSFKRLEFVDHFRAINYYDETPTDLIEQGYLFYKTGNFIRAVETFEKAHEKSIKNSQLSLAFICKFNLSKLALFIGNFWYEIPERDEILYKLRKINVDKFAIAYKTPENNEILEWITKEKFYTSYHNRILENTQKIIEQYYSSLKKGRSSNSHVWKLINDYGECISFLESNKIIYDQFSEFYELNKVFTEGIFASHAIKKPYNSRLSSFSDWILKQLIFNGDAQHILKTARRYNLTLFEYSSEENNDSFKNLVTNFFSYDTEMWSEYKKVQVYNIGFFKNYYNRIYANILALLALCDLKKKYINAFIPQLIEFHQNEEVIDWSQIKYMRIFIHRKKNLLTIKNLRLLFKSLIPLAKFHDENILESVCEIIVSRNQTVTLSKANFNLIMNMAFTKCEICKRNHPTTIIIPILRAIHDDTQKNRIKERIIECLENNFDFDLYYQAQIYSLMGDKKSWFELAVEKCIPVKLKKRPLVFIFDETPIHRPLNDLLNLCFKNNVDLDRKPFKRARFLSPYYDWLLDMENFDYTKFQVEWITEYSTKFYYKRMGECKNLRNALERYLKDNVDSLIETYYLDIFIRKAWQND